jgi:hypothetical protein
LLICFVTIIFGLGPLTLNELTPEEAANLEAAQRHSSRGSIPVMVEEPNIIPTPDDESEDGSEEENEGNSVEGEIWMWLPLDPMYFSPHKIFG